MGGVSCTPVTYFNSSCLSCVVSSGSGSNNAVVVTTQSLSSTPVLFYSYGLPVVSSIFPTSGSALGGYPVTISGLNFASTQGTVSIGPYACTVTSWSNIQILCTVPLGQSFNMSVTVVASGLVSTQSNVLFSYRAPNITSVLLFR